MKKILFGINSNPDKKHEEIILNKYKQETGEEFEYHSEYYLEGLRKCLDEQEFDILILKEDLEGKNCVTVEYLDEITDRFPNLKIIFIVNDEHDRDDYIKKLFNIGIYNIIKKNDLTVTTLVDLINKGRTKLEAKIYLDLDETEVKQVENLEEIPYEELEKILIHLNNATEDTISSLYDEINRQYNKKQMITLISTLSNEIIDLLVKSNNKDFLNHYKKWLIIEEKYKETEKKETDNTPKIIEKEKIVYNIPSDYRKVVAFIGNKKVGTTTIINLISNKLVDRNKKVAILDLSKNKTSYYMWLWNNPKYNEEFKQGLNYIVVEEKPFKINKYLSLYTQDKNNKEKIDITTIIEKLKYENDLVLIDMDFNANIEILKFMIDTIYIVHDMNIYDLIETKNYVKNLYKQGINPKKINLIINKYIKSAIKDKDIINMFTNPIKELELEEQDSLQLFNNCFKINFNEDVYRNYLNISVYKEEDIIKDKVLDKQLEEIIKHIYPIEDIKPKFSLRKLFKI